MTDWLQPDRHANREPRWFAADIALAALFVWITIASLRSAAYVDEFGDVDAAGLWLAVAPTLLLPFRRLAPATVLCLATLLYLVASASQGDSNAPLAIPFFAYSVGLTRPPDASGALVAASALALSTAVFYGPGDPDALTVVVVFALYGIGWLLSLSIRRHRDRSERLQRATEQMRIERAEIAAEAAGDERDRIARELHDAVGHAVNVIVLQAGAARMSGDPEHAARSLREIEHLGRDALTDLDDMLGLLKGDAGAPRSPTSTRADIARLVDETRATGAQVTLTDRCETDWDRAVGSAVYRIVQEALTNALKHGGGAPVAVNLSSDEREVRVRVTNPMSSRHDLSPDRATVPEHRGGRGLPGMVERVNIVGGTIDTGPDASGSFVVEAHLPQTSRTSRSGVGVGSEPGTSPRSADR